MSGRGDCVECAGSGVDQEMPERMERCPACDGSGRALPSLDGEEMMPFDPIVEAYGPHPSEVP